MRVHVISDLHLDFADWRFTDDTNAGDVVVNAGDTHPDSRVREHFKSVMPDGRHYLEVLGNHDFYGRDFPTPGTGQWRKTIDGVKFAGATLWTDLSGNDGQDWVLYVMGLIDYRMIASMNYTRYNAAYELDRSFLFESDADVFVTHHSPSLKSCHEKWAGSAFNRSFHNDLDEAILAMGRKAPALWVHGHTHDASDYVIGHTRVVCNPRGYPMEGNHAGYAPKVVEL